jgi:hypothetical protein
MQDVTVSAALEEKATSGSCPVRQKWVLIGYGTLWTHNTINGCLITLNFFKYPKSMYNKFLSFNYCYELSEYFKKGPYTNISVKLLYDNRAYIYFLP